MTCGHRVQAWMILCCVFLIGCTRGTIDNENITERCLARRAFSRVMFPRDQYCRLVSTLSISAGSRLQLRRGDSSFWTWYVTANGYAVMLVRTPDRHDPDSKKASKNERLIFFLDARSHNAVIVTADGSCLTGIISDAQGTTINICWAEF